MSITALSIFLISVLIGSYVQSVAGFAMGMIIIAVVGGAQIMPLPVLTAVVSLLSLINVLVAVRGELGYLHRRLFVWLAIGQISAIWLGVYLLEHLNANAHLVLRVLLGLFITLGSLSMVIKPHPKSQLSSPFASLVAGGFGGVVGGMFSASGPVMGWFTYRQPLPWRELRVTLLCCFAVTGITRSIAVGIQGGLTGEVFTLFAYCVPIVVFGTWAGKVMAPPVSELVMKRLAFGLLLAIGIGILVDCYFDF